MRNTWFKCGKILKSAEGLQGSYRGRNYDDVSFILVEDLEETTDLRQVTDKLSYLTYLTYPGGVKPGESRRIESNALAHWATEIPPHVSQNPFSSLGRTGDRETSFLSSGLSPLLLSLLRVTGMFASLSTDSSPDGCTDRARLSASRLPLFSPVDPFDLSRWENIICLCDIHYHHFPFHHPVWRQQMRPWSHCQQRDRQLHTPSKKPSHIDAKSVLFNGLYIYKGRAKLGNMGYVKLIDIYISYLEGVLYFTLFKM